MHTGHKTYSMTSVQEKNFKKKKKRKKTFLGGDQALRPLRSRGDVRDPPCAELQSGYGWGGVGWGTTAGTGGWPVSLDSTPTPQICAETERRKQDWSSGYIVPCSPEASLTPGNHTELP